MSFHRITYLGYSVNTAPHMIRLLTAHVLQFKKLCVFMGVIASMHNIAYIVYCFFLWDRIFLISVGEIIVWSDSPISGLCNCAQDLVRSSMGDRKRDAKISLSLSTVIYRVIHKSLRDFRTRLRNNQDRHGRKEHINR